MAALNSERVAEERLTMTDWWYQCRNYPAAIEQFFDVSAESGIVEWIGSYEGGVGLIACGRSFQLLGDMSAAFACYRLAEVFQKMPVDDVQNEYNDARARVIADIADGLSEVKCHDTARRSRGAFWLGGGSHIVAHLLANGARTRAPPISRNVPRFSTGYFPAVHWKGSSGI